MPTRAMTKTQTTDRSQAMKHDHESPRSDITSSIDNDYTEIDCRHWLEINWPAHIKTEV